MDKPQVLRWLEEIDPHRLETLWNRANQVRHECVGDQVHLRGLIEISNHRVFQCTYCGLRSSNRTLERYRMSADEIMDCVDKAVAYGYGTVVLQSGEDHGISASWLADIVRRIKSQTPLAVTLSFGERTTSDLATWRQAGADRYLLRFETSDRGLYERIHPSLPGRRSDRFEILHRLEHLGYETGSGVMIGIPGQTYDSLAQDIMLFARLKLDMIGVGPYIEHPRTPLARMAGKMQLPPGQQVPNTERMTCKVIALTRLLCPWANIPSTTALAVIGGPVGCELGLMCGANVIMPNVTPKIYRNLYDIYPRKSCACDASDEYHTAIIHRITSMARTVGIGRGDSRKHDCATHQATMLCKEER